jgi:hypothetical protein
MGSDEESDLKYMQLMVNPLLQDLVAEIIEKKPDDPVTYSTSEL